MDSNAVVQCWITHLLGTFCPPTHASPWLVAFKAANGQWAKELSFDEGRAGTLLAWFRDVRKVTNTELTFEWLMRLVARSEPLYHDFASDRLIRTFIPADFASATMSCAEPNAPTSNSAFPIIVKLIPHKT